MTRPIRWVAFGCSHAPRHDWAAIDFVRDQILDHKPDLVIHLGDLLEADAAARFDNEESWELEDEYREGDAILEYIGRAAGSARKVFIPGNHDYNIEATGRIPKKLRSLAAYRRNLKTLAMNGGEWYHGAEYLYDRARGVYRIGQVTFAHGYEAGVQADRNQAITLGVPQGLLVSVHTHRPKQVQQAMMNASTPLPYWFANAGTTRDIVDVAYMDRKRRLMWGQACVVGEASPNSGLAYGPEWSAETRVFRMYDEAVAARTRGLI